MRNRSASPEIQCEKSGRDPTEKKVHSYEYADHPKFGNPDSFASPATKECRAKNKGDETCPDMPAAIRNISRQRRNDIEDSGNDEVHRHDQGTNLSACLCIGQHHEASNAEENRANQVKVKSTPPSGQIGIDRFNCRRTNE